MFSLRAIIALALALFNRAISSPPHAPPDPGESLRVRADFGLEAVFVTIAGPTVTIVQMILWAGTLCELIAPLAIGGSESARAVSTLFLFAPSHLIRLRVTVFGGFGAAMGFCGCLLRYGSFQMLGSLFTYQLAIRKNHTLITTGPYHYVRHPAYTGSLLAALGTAMFFLSEGSYLRECGALNTYGGAVCVAVWVSWKIFMAMNVVRRTGIEDEFLKDKFGPAWTAWSNTVKYKLVPGIF